MSNEKWPQSGRERMILSSPIGRAGFGIDETSIEREFIKKMDIDHVMMMGDNPALPLMPEKPTLLDFFKYRFGDLTLNHLLGSAKQAMDKGEDDKIVLAILLHDISNGCLIRVDHGYWGAQLVEPYVDPEVVFGIRYHQALRYYADEEVGYEYPKSYDLFFGADYEPPEYIRKDAEYARSHKWYMTARLVTLYDAYFFDEVSNIDPEIFSGVIERSFKQPKEGLGFDNSASAHMWRTMIWPNNFL